MTKEKKDKAGGKKMPFSRYIPQIITWGVLGVTVGGIYWLYRPFWYAYWLPILITTLGLCALTLLSFWRSLWRNYRWIVGSTILILLVLINVSWVKSHLGINAFEKRQFIQYLIPDSNAVLQVEYQSRILYDNQNTPTLILWVKTPAPFPSPTVKITAGDLLLGTQILKDSPVQWEEIVQKSLPTNGDAITIFLLPISQNLDTTKEITLSIEIVSAKSSQTRDLTIKIEGRRDAQRRIWANVFLDTGGVIVSLVLGVFAALKQLDDEKKRQKIKQIEQVISNFDTDAKNDILKTLQDHLKLAEDWNEWDEPLQDQSCKAYASFVEVKLWDALATKTTSEIIGAVDLFLQMCEEVFRSEKEKPISTLKQLQSALRQDDDAPLVLLSMLKEYPASINTAKIIVSAFPPDLKRKTIIEFAGKFLDQIRALRIELGFSETKSFPIQEQFVFYTKEHIPTDRLTAWMNAHELEYSPFADADKPFYSVFDKQLLIDWAAPGFSLPTPNLWKKICEFENSWDAGAALFEYCKGLQSNIRLMDDVFFAIVTPGMVENYGGDHPQKLYLHALAEQWIWSLAETPTLFYSMEGDQRELTGRLLRWHDFSPFIVVNKIAEFTRHLQGKKKEGEKEEKKNQMVFLSKIMEWLTSMNANEIRTEEINALIGLRPSPKQRTLFLISTIDLNSHVERQILPNLHKRLGKQSDWLNAHNCGFARFQVGDKNQQIIPLSGLVNLCNIRVQKCSKYGNIVFNQLFNAPSKEPDAILAQKANGSPGRMVRLGQKLLLQHVAKSSPEDYLQIEDLIVLE
jgi:hypothetical protein